MIEIWDTFRGSEDAKIEVPKASRGEVWGLGKGYPPPHSTRGSGDRSRDLVENGFGAFLSSLKVQ